jgi:hypothetical protein
VPDEPLPNALCFQLSAFCPFGGRNRTGFLINTLPTANCPLLSAFCSLLPAHLAGAAGQAFSFTLANCDRNFKNYLPDQFLILGGLDLWHMPILWEKYHKISRP